MRFNKDGRMTEVPDPDDKTGSAAAKAATPLAQAGDPGRLTITPGLLEEIRIRRGLPPRAVTVIRGPSGRAS